MANPADKIREVTFYLDNTVNIAPICNGQDLPIEQIDSILSSNNCDEIVIRTDRGDRYLIWADELDVKNMPRLPGIGRKISYRGIEGKVVYVDNEFNEEWQKTFFVAASLLPAYPPSFPAANAIAFFSNLFDPDFSGIKKLTECADPSSNKK